MTSYTFSQKQFTPIPPEKGSFPLDHEGRCKRLMIDYMRCLLTNGNENAMCREQAKLYLGCRMENELMAKEDWDSLGFNIKET